MGFACKKTGGRMENAEVLLILDAIEDQMMHEGVLGFSPAVLAVLDDMDASNNEIESLKFRIGRDVLMRIFNYASSAYWGSLKKGSIQTFYEVVTRLGMAHTKAMILILSLKMLAHDDPEIEEIFARCFSAATLGKIMAGQFGMREESAKKVELGGLFSETGRMIMEVYKKRWAPDDERIDLPFVEKYHTYLTERLIERFALPDYLKGMIFHDGIVIEANYFTLASLTQLAVNMVAVSFQKYHGRLVIEALPLPEGQDRSHSLEHMIVEQFNSVGLGKYLRIIHKKERILPVYEYAGSNPPA
jgi:hypothetical protein